MPYHAANTSAPDGNDTDVFQSEVFYNSIRHIAEQTPVGHLAATKGELKAATVKTAGEGSIVCAYGRPVALIGCRRGQRHLFRQPIVLRPADSRVCIGVKGRYVALLHRNGAGFRLAIGNGNVESPTYSRPLRHMEQAVDANPSGNAVWPS